MHRVTGLDTVILDEAEMERRRRLNEALKRSADEIAGRMIDHGAGNFMDCSDYHPDNRSYWRNPFENRYFRRGFILVLIAVLITLIAVTK